jgi:hypothetical protein
MRLLSPPLTVSCLRTSLLANSKNGEAPDLSGAPPFLLYIGKTTA